MSQSPQVSVCMPGSDDSELGSEDLRVRLASDQCDREMAAQPCHVVPLRKWTSAIAPALHCTCTKNKIKSSVQESGG